jgi:hypothetical protein
MIDFGLPLDKTNKAWTFCRSEPQGEQTSNIFGGSIACCLFVVDKAISSIKNNSASQVNAHLGARNEVKV